MPMSFSLLVACFWSIFLAELPDKTSLVVITLAARGRWTVWLGASLALVLQAALAVVAGHLIGHMMGPWLKWMEALAFVGFGLYLWREAGEEDEPEPFTSNRRSVFQAAFLLVFLAEFGDLTQFSIVAWSARLNAPGTVLMVSSLALIAAAAVSATFGELVGKRMAVSTIRRISAVIFVGLGALMLAV